MKLRVSVNNMLAALGVPLSRCAEVKAMIDKEAREEVVAHSTDKRSIVLTTRSEQEEKIAREKARHERTMAKYQESNQIGLEAKGDA